MRPVSFRGRLSSISTAPPPTLQHAPATQCGSAHLEANRMSLVHRFAMQITTHQQLAPSTRWPPQQATCFLMLRRPYPTSAPKPGPPFPRHRSLLVPFSDLSVMHISTCGQTLLLPTLFLGVHSVKGWKEACIRILAGVVYHTEEVRK